MIRQLFSTLPLLLFVALVLFVGYSMFQGLAPTLVAQVPTNTVTATQAPSPTATNTPVPTTTVFSASPTEPASPTSAPTQTLLSPTPTETPLPTPSPTPSPSTIVWVHTNQEFGEAPHTLGIIVPDTTNPLLQPYAAAPALSPDGKKVAFFSESSLSGYNTGIWVAELKGAQIENHKLLADVTDVQNIAWSPDGDKVAFEVILNPADPRPEWRSQIRVIRSNPDDAYIELDRFDGRQPAWSPDSQKLVFYTCRGSQCGLFLVNCAGGNCDEDNAEQITFDSTDAYPAWSIDNNLAFSSKRSGDYDLYLLNLADNDLHNLTNRPSIDTTPIFNQNGQKIFFRTDYPDGLEWQIQAITLNDDKRTVGEIDTLIGDVSGDNDWGLAKPAVR